jgi:S-DNA-T family DNA segregation ATPase FtsK/SpoIIIE
MLYLPLDASRPERVQGVFISDGEVEHLVEFWKTTPWGPLDEIPLQAAPGEGDSEQSGAGSDGADELLDKAIGLAMSHNKLSTSLMQRRLRIGYPRAARLMDELEDRGIVGPSDGSRSRDVIIGSV